MNMGQQQQHHPRLGHMTVIETIGSFQRAGAVDVAGIAKELGIELVIDRGLTDDISGKIERTARGRSGFRIVVNGNHSLTRQRFTIAHELAHYALHRDLIGDGIVDDALYRSRESNAIERQANSYAATILMPANAVRAAWRNGAKSYGQMAEAFQVSPEVARIRMRELRLG